MSDWRDTPITIAYDLDALATRYGLVVGRRNARQITVLCVTFAHEEKTPSLVIWRDWQTWHCFGCQRGGTVSTLVARLEGQMDAGGICPSTGRDNVPGQLGLWDWATCELDPLRVGSYNGSGVRNG